MSIDPQTTRSIRRTVFRTNSVNSFSNTILHFFVLPSRPTDRHARRVGQLQHHRQGAETAVRRHESRARQVAATLGQAAERAASDAASQRARCVLQFSGTQRIGESNTHIHMRTIPFTVIMCANDDQLAHAFIEVSHARFVRSINVCGRRHHADCRWPCVGCGPS